MRYKPWSMLEAWTEIFGKDRANGDGAEDLLEAVNELIEEDDPSPNVKPLNNVDDLESPRNYPEVSSHANKKTNGSKLSGTKRPAEVSMEDRLVETLNQMQRSTEAGLQSITRVLEYESNLGQTRKNLFAMLDELEEFSLDEKLAASHLLAKNAECLEMFIGLPPHARYRYVRGVLDNEFS